MRHEGSRLGTSLPRSFGSKAREARSDEKRSIASRASLRNEADGDQAMLTVVELRHGAGTPNGLSIGTRRQAVLRWKRVILREQPTREFTRIRLSRGQPGDALQCVGGINVGTHRRTDPRRFQCQPSL